MVRQNIKRKPEGQVSDERAFRDAVAQIENKIHSKPIDSQALAPAIQRLKMLAKTGHNHVKVWPALEGAIRTVFPHHKKWDEERTSALIMKEVATLELVADDNPVEINELRHIKKFCENFAKAFQQILAQHRAAQRKS